MAKLTRKQPWRKAILLAAVLGMLPAAGAAAGEVYYYQDESGVYHFTEKPRPGARRFVLDPEAERAAARVAKPRPPRARRPVAVASPTRRYDAYIHRYAAEYEIEPALVKAVIHAESGFDRFAVSRRGARGLMQLMPRTARSYGVRDLHDAQQNIRCGVRHLRHLLDRFASLRLAVAAYNAGAGAVRRYGGLPPYRETRRYVEKVLRFRARYLAEARLARAAGDESVREG